MKRTFIGVKIKPEEEIHNFLSILKDKLHSENIKWVDPSNFHITLYFLGDTEIKNIPMITNDLKQLGENHSSFDFECIGAGVFKNYQNPKVLWIGIQEFSQLSDLKINIENILSSYGYQKENRGFKPHLTIGRVKYINDRKNLECIFKEFTQHRFQSVKVYGFTFYESVLTSSGPIYKPIAEITLD